jgi:RNA polymerase sigma factor (sigma-70 family)
MEAGALRAPAALNRISVTAPLLRLRSDEQLVALFRAGNDAAFSVIHDRYRQRLFAYSRQMLGGSRQDAEDALQDVFMRAYSSLRLNDRPLSLRAWLYRVAHNRCIDQLRRPAPPAADLFDTSRKPLLDPMDEAERREDLRQLVADVRRLPEQQRSALLMREIDGLSYAELSSALGISLQAVKSLLVRARIGLVEAVEARDTACSQIRLDLTDAFDRGVRASGLARRHLRDCDGCVEYRAQLRGVRQGLGVLSPGGSGPLATILKLIGIGGAGSAGAASAGGGAAAGTGVLAAAGTGTAVKVAAVVCCAALTAGGAVEVVNDQIVRKAPARAAARRHGAPRPAAATTTVHGPVAGSLASATPIVAVGERASNATRKVARSAIGERETTAGRHLSLLPTGGGASAPISEQQTDVTLGGEDDNSTGGASAPHEDTGFGPDGLTPNTGAGTSTATGTGAGTSAPTSGQTAPATGSADATTGHAPAGGTATSAGSAATSGSTLPG